MRTFKFTKEESKLIKTWEAKHEEECSIVLEYKSYGMDTSIPFGAIGGGKTYCFTPTSIGTFIKVECACGEFYLVPANL